MAAEAGGCERHPTDHIKVVLTGHREVRGMPTLDGETVRTLVEAGHSHGLLGVAHIETPGP